MTDPNGSGNENNALPDFEARLTKLRSQHWAEEEREHAMDFGNPFELPVVEPPEAELPKKAPAPRPTRPASARPDEKEGRGGSAAAPVRKAPSASAREGSKTKTQTSSKGQQPRKKPGSAGAQGVKKSASTKKPPKNVWEDEDDDAYFERKRNDPVKGFFRFLGRSLLTILSTVLLLVLALAAAITIVCRGPSTEARRLFVCSTNETSALKSVPRYFLPDSVVDSILHPVVEEQKPDDFVELPTEVEAIARAEQGEVELVTVDENAAQQALEIIDIKGATFKGKMLIVHDPHKVLLASLEQFGEYGIFLTEFIEQHGAIAGTNAGGFYDPDGQGNGGTPDGLVIRDGAIAFGSPYNRYVDVIGFDADRVLHCGDMTAQEALDMGVVEAISFSAGPVLIQDGVKRTGLGGGVNPRTCIGQRADGAVLLMVVEGRHPDSLGATYDDLANLMEEYGAVNAGNLDGGSSSAMIYNGEQITKGSTIIGSRRMATAILVLP